jgi:hypothetical protein
MIKKQYKQTYYRKLTVVLVIKTINQPLHKENVDRKEVFVIKPAAFYSLPSILHTIQ